MRLCTPRASGWIGILGQCDQGEEAASSPAEGHPGQIVILFWPWSCDALGKANMIWSKELIAGIRGPDAYDQSRGCLILESRLLFRFFFASFAPHPTKAI